MPYREYDLESPMVLARERSLCQRKTQNNTRESSLHTGDCHLRNARRRETGKKQARSHQNTTDALRYPCLICMFSCAFVCLICCFFSVPALVCVLNRKKVWYDGWLHKERESRFAQLISARDCFRDSEPKDASRPTLPVTIFARIHRDGAFSSTEISFRRR